LQLDLQGDVPAGTYVGVPRLVQATDLAERNLTLTTESSSTAVWFAPGLSRRPLQVVLPGKAARAEEIRGVLLMLPVEMDVRQRLLGQLTVDRSLSRPSTLGPSMTRLTIEDAAQRGPQLKFSLTLSGGAYRGAPAIAVLRDAGGQSFTFFLHYPSTRPRQQWSPEDGLLLPRLPTALMPGNLAGLALAPGPTTWTFAVYGNMVPMRMPWTVTVHEARVVRTEVPFAFPNLRR
jgi:hypothetical protein